MTGRAREISQRSISQVMLKEFGVYVSLNRSFAYQQMSG